ncbi:MAG TPA: cyclic nucleotide-binding domain-containing protein [Mariprofundaceae bacterium]|nr:cyclic nucleotide-binding domain-containing protein [Mariprofundaceae bacterium]
MNIDFHWLENRIFHRTLNDEEKRFLAGIIDLVEFQPGESILVQNEPGGALYLLYSGRADVLQQFADMEVRLNGVGEGAQLGDMSIIDERDASATIRATEPCKAYKLNRDALSRLLYSHDDIARDLLINTLRNMSGVIRDLNQSNAAAHSYIQGRRV